MNDMPSSKNSGISSVLIFVIGFLFGGVVVFSICFLLGMDGLAIDIGEKLDHDIVYHVSGDSFEGIIISDTEDELVLKSNRNNIHFKRNEIKSIDHDYKTKYITWLH